jgi:hypothetical protein
MIKNNLAKLINLFQRYGRYDDVIAVKCGKCFIVGSGPSINDVDFRHMNGSFSIGLNSVYKRIKTNILFIADKYVLMKHIDEIDKLSGVRLFLFESASRYYNNYMKRRSYISTYRDMGNAVVWNRIATSFHGFYSGYTVLVEAIQWANLAGFDEVYLLGCDFDYSGMHHFDGRSASEVGEHGGMAAGKYRRVFDALRILKRDCRCSIYNCTEGTRDPVFEKKRLEDIV